MQGLFGASWRAEGQNAGTAPSGHQGFGLDQKWCWSDRQASSWGHPTPSRDLEGSHSPPSLRKPGTQDLVTLLGMCAVRGVDLSYL